jgi:hypothetical protein
MEFSENFISGEKIQEIADLYFGSMEDFIWNPKIMDQIEKHQIIDDIFPNFDNPKILFVYAHRLKQFADKIENFLNSFILITHNADTNLTEENPDVLRILQSDKLIGWWGQNLCFIHPKMHPVPIGLANSMWEHGNTEAFTHLEPFCLNNSKSKELYVNFNEYTNPCKRKPCLMSVNKYGVLPMVNFVDHIKRLSEYKFCACPEGNGVDTHRIWEALYLNCSPVVVKTPFIETLMHYTQNRLPIIVLNSWDNYEPYSIFTQNYSELLTVEYYRRQIYSLIK